MTARYSLPLLSTMALALIFAAASMAQDRQPAGHLDAEAIVHNERDTFTLRHFDPDGTGAIILSTDGYVFGTNNWGDLGIAVAFELPPGMSSAQVIEVNGYIFRSDFPTMGSYEVAIYGGNTTTGPADEIYAEMFDLDHIDNVGPEGPFDLVVHELDDPPTVDGDHFFAAIRWDPGYDPEDLGMVSTTELASPSPYEWTMEDTGTWMNTAALWQTNGWHVWVEAVVQDAISTEPGAEPRTFRLSSVYPNPVAGRSHVQLDLEAAQHVSVEVFNLLGQRVATVFDGTAEAGRSVLNVEGSSLSAGVYLLRIAGDDFAETRKFVVAH